MLSAIAAFTVIIAAAVAYLLAQPQQHTRDQNQNPPQNQPRRIKPTTPATPSESSKNQHIITVKGKIGEQLVKLQVMQHLDPRCYRAFYDLIVPIDGETTQIDSIIVSPFGIFVIEAKYYNGWIYGSAKQKHWTMTQKNGSKFPFQNPLHQNYKHIKALSQLLQLPENVFHTGVVFCHRDCCLKTKLPPQVMTIDRLLPYIAGFTKTLLTGEQCTAALGILSQPQWIATEENLRRHVESLQQRHTP